MSSRSTSEGSHLYLSIIQQAFEHSGGDFHKLCKQLPADEYRNLNLTSDHPIPTKTILKLWSLAAEHNNNPLLGLHAGMDIAPTQYGLLGHILLNCATLLEDIKLVVQFKRLMLNDFNVKLLVGEHETHYSLDLAPRSAEEERYIVEFDIASIVAMSRSVLAPADRLKLNYTKIQFRHLIPSHQLSHYENFFGCPIETGCQQAGIFIDSHLLNFPLRGADSGIHDLLLNKLNRFTNKIEESPSSNLAASVEQYMHENMEPSFPTAEEIARSLGLSLSTMKRKLRASNTSYQLIADNMRYKQASRILQDDAISIANIGFMLGFSSVSSFSRSFKQWSGLSPSEFRKQK